MTKDSQQSDQKKQRSGSRQGSSLDKKASKLGASKKGSSMDNKAGKPGSSMDNKAGKPGASKHETSLSPTKESSTRFKQIVEKSTKVAAVKKFIWIKGGNPEVDNPDSPIYVARKVWDSPLADLSLKKKQSSQIYREMGIKHVRIVLPTPDTRDVVVRRKHDNKRRTSVGVLRSLKADLDIKPFTRLGEFKGPRCCDKGEIIPHTILGDVTSFLSEAQRRGEFKELRDSVSSKEAVTVATVKQSPRLPYNPLLNEDKALNNWVQEMFYRRQEQKRLAGVLGRGEGELLMCKSDHHTKKEELRRMLQDAQERTNLAPGFWRLMATYGHQQIRPTVTRSEEGHVMTPVISGDADSIIRTKGKFSDASPNTWLQSEYLKERDEKLGGVIHVMNNLLFDKLEVAGEAIYPPHQTNSLYSLAPGDKGNNSGCVSSKGDNSASISVNISQQGPGSRDIPSELRGGNSVNNSADIPGPEVKSPCIRGDNSKSLTPCLRGDISTRESLNTATSKQLSTISVENSSLSPVAVLGPALCVDGMILRWHGNNEACPHHGNTVAKETFVLLEGEVGEVVRQYVEITNCGTTSIQYNWQKLPDLRPLPIARPKRQPFYFMADEGVILPRQTMKVLVLFRSPIAGYFSQSWAVTTVPVLDRGAMIKFTFKGVARGDGPFSPECLNVEKYLLVNQGRSICEHEARRIVELSILTGSLQDNRLTEEPEFVSLEQLFEQENPGMYYHDNIIHRLEELFKADSMETKADIRKDSNVISVAKLRQVLLSNVCKKEEELDKRAAADEDVDNNCATFLHAQSLLHQFHCEVGQLTFQPFLPISQPGQHYYMATYSLLQYGLDCVTLHAYSLTHKLGLIIREEDEDRGDNCESRTGRRKKTGVKTKGKAERNNKIKPTKGASSTENSAPMDQSPASPENKSQPTVYSAAYKFRTLRGNSSSLHLYDEKVYLEMYAMLEKTLDTICDLFGDR